ncbi:gliding motility-associated C-terminal domain-containing protein [Cyclobacterium jeungdonense]|uniref:Gliding motility-associated C-terminal domain-containing protein n=1 Tax=Cyclobacterium jeungdonense TaxID=708087 RepID=A0ABT8C2Y8_9BACT|nr:gliding motility-associated C-terminal domain-containing protein [Cyclobacterium jeungdonense]MDN3686732.1 gliding motility-associated C-terminal domain-containing protein [Cyclobacterium jeungdonense]
MKYVPFIVGLVVLMIASVTTSQATHIRAGEIIAERISTQTLTYRITVVGYTDTRSTVVFGPGEIDFGDGRSEVLNTESDFNLTENLGNNIEKNVFVITHTYQGPGNYTIRFMEFNRNANTLNMDQSVDTPFYIETMISIDPFLGVNNSPILTIAPVDNGAVNQTYIHNPGAYDPDGDSLAYVLDVPKQAFQREVNNYRSPASGEFSFTRQDGTTPPFLELDPVTGDLIWDAPGIAGQYNVAFRIEEWRMVAGKWERIGYVLRDMQIIIENTDNRRPELIMPEDICVEAGTEITEIFQGMDPDGDPIMIEVFGDPVEITSSPASYSPESTFQPSPGIISFQWQTVCNHVRARTYQVRVRIQDQPDSGPALVDIKTWNITIVAPPPVPYSIEQQQGRSARLEWDPYVCSNAAETMQVWRRINSDPYEPDSCETGIREGYTLVGETSMETFDFQDTNQGMGLSPGNTYCYRLVAAFPSPRSGESYVSEEICITVDVDVPLITNVSVEETSSDSGEILVRWTPPYDIDTEIYPGPFTYELIRNQGFTGANGTTSLITTADTVFRDSQLNTENLVYNYKVILLSNGEKIDTSSVASSVRVDPTIINEAIELQWEFQVPWNNEDATYPHLVYRNRTDPDAEDTENFTLIAEVNVTQDGFVYLDDGNHNGIPLDTEKEYCYYVVTNGSYNLDILEYPLANNSQIVCARPDDDRLPCPPVLSYEGPECTDFLADKPCNFSDFYHDLSWEPDFTGECDSELNGYRIYFSNTGEEGTFNLVSTVPVIQMQTRIEGLTELKGCYYITAVDRSGNESEPSNIVCIDNCPNYELPNVFTPNGDNINDTFQAFDNPYDKCPRFVEAVEINIYNRWGTLVHSYNSTLATENDIYINWDGRDTEGNELPSGTYYYEATVYFNVLDENLRQNKSKGTIQLMK